MTPENASSLNGKAEQRHKRATPAKGRAVGSVSGAADPPELVAARRELADLQRQVAELDAEVAVLRNRSADRPAGAHGVASLSQIATSVATTFLVGAVVRRLRLGFLGAAAAPLLAAQIIRRLWPVQ